MNEPQQQKKDDGEIDNRTANIIMLVSAVAVIGTGIWLVNAMLDARDADNCMSSGQRGCGKIEIPAR